MAFGDAQAEAVDLTLVLDPAAVWPDPMSCPDWPIRPLTTRTGMSIQGEADARGQLEQLIRMLARSERVREPTEEERQAAFAAHFRRLDNPDLGGWRGIIHGLEPLNHVVETRARQIVEGLHLRGYLRKLEARRQREAEGRDERRRNEREARLKKLQPQAAEISAQLEPLLEAEARHQQRLDDAKAWAQAQNLRLSLQGAHDEARAVAGALGVEPPKLAEMPPKP